MSVLGHACDINLDVLRDVRRFRFHGDCLVLDERDRSGEGVPDHDDGDVDRDGLTLAHDDEVDVFDDLTNVVLLNVLDENEFLLALDVEVDENVLVTNEKGGANRSVNC